MNNRPYEISDDVNSIFMESCVSDNKSEFAINPTEHFSPNQVSMASSFRSLNATPIETIITTSNSKKSKRRLIFTMLFVIFLLSVILFYKLFHSLTQNNSQNDDSILMSLTSKVKSIKKNQLDSKASLITIVDDESDKVHFSISVNTNGMSNDVINEGLLYKEMAMNYMILIPFKKFENRNKERLIVFNITKSEVMNGYTRVDIEIDSDKFNEFMNFWTSWIEIYSQRLYDQPTFRNVLYTTIVNSISNNNDDIDSNQFYSRKNDDEYIEDRIIDDILYNNSDISMSLAQFVKNNVINNNVTLIQKKIDALIGKYYIGENVNIVLYAKSSLIEDATMSINKAMNVFPIAENSDENVHTSQSLNKGKIVWFKSNSIGRYITLCYIISNITNKNDMIYLDYLSYHLQSKRNRTIFERLVTNGFIEELKTSCSPLKQISNGYLLKMKLRLTTLGAYNIEDITLNVTSYIKSFNMMKPKSDIEFKDYVLSKKNAIRFKEPSVYDIINEYQKVLINKISYKDYDSIKIQNYPRMSITDEFNINNIILFYESKLSQSIAVNIFSEGEQKKYNKTIYIDDHNTSVEYYNCDIPKEINTKGYHNNTIKIYSKNSLPDISLGNEFITSNSKSIPFTEDNEITPMKVYSSNRTIIWVKTDRSFMLPKVVVNIHFVSMYIRSSKEKEYFAHVLFYKQLERKIQFRLNDAILAGNTITMKLNDNGFHIKIVAFNDVIAKILDIISSIYFNPKLSMYNYQKTRSETFNFISYYTMKQRGIRLFRRLVKFNKFYFVNDIPFNCSEVINTMNNIPYNSLVTMLFYGDIEKESVLSMVEQYKQKMKEDSFEYTLNDKIYSNSSELLSALHFNVPYNGSVVIRKVNSDDEQTKSMVMNYYRIMNISDIKKIQLTILVKLLQEYINSMFDYEFNVIDYDGYLYLYIGGESDSKSPATMNKEIDMKIKTFRSTLPLLSQKEFNTIKARTSLQSKLRFDSLETKAHKVWKEIYLSTYQFTPSAISSLIVSLEKESLISMYEELFFNESSIRKISIQLYRYDIEMTGDTEEAYLVNEKIKTVIKQDIDIFHSRYSVS